MERRLRDLVLFSSRLQRLVIGFLGKSDALRRNGDTPQITLQYCRPSYTTTTMPRVMVRQERKAAVEDKIRRALEKRGREGTSFQGLATGFGVPLNDAGREHTKSRPYPQPPRRHWTSTVFLPGSTFSRRWQRMRNEMGIPNLQNLGRAGCRGSSTVTLMFPRSLDPIWTVNVHWQVTPDPLSTISHFLPEDIYNMDEKGFILGMSSRAKVICRAGMPPPRVMQDGTRELITVIETICAGTAAQFILLLMAIYKGAALV